MVEVRQPGLALMVVPALPGRRRTASSGWCGASSSGPGCIGWTLQQRQRQRQRRGRQRRWRRRPRQRRSLKAWPPSWPLKPRRSCRSAGMLALFDAAHCTSVHCACLPCLASCLGGSATRGRRRQHMVCIDGSGAVLLFETAPPWTCAGASVVVVNRSAERMRRVLGILQGWSCSVLTPPRSAPLAVHLQGQQPWDAALRQEATPLPCCAPHQTRKALTVRKGNCGFLSPFSSPRRGTYVARKRWPPASSSWRPRGTSPLWASAPAMGPLRTCLLPLPPPLQRQRAEQPS